VVSRIGSALGLRPGEGRTLGPASAFAFLAVGVSILAAVAGDALFVSTFSLGKLSRFSIVAPLVKVAAAFGYAAVARRAPGAHRDALMLGATAALLAATGAAAARGGATVVYAVCLALLVLPPLLPLVAFNAVASCFDARQAKRLFPLVAAAATVGTIAAGAAARASGAGIGTAGLLLVGAVACVGALPLPRVLAKRARDAGAEPEAPKPGAPSGGGFFATIAEAAGDVRVVPVVTIVVANAALGAAGMTFADYAFKAALKARYAQGEMAAYLGTFTIASNALVLGAQLLLTSRVVGRFGVRTSLRLVPASLALTGPVAALAPGVASATAVRLGELVTRLSIGNSVADLLLTPAPAAVRVRAKTFVKGAAGPIGALGAGVVLAAFGEHGPPALAMGALVALTGVAGLFALRGAQRAYTAALAEAVGQGRLATDVSASTVAVLRGELGRLLAAAAEADDVAGAERALSVLGDRTFSLDDVAAALRAKHPAIRRAAVETALRLARPGEGERLLALAAPDDDDEVERRVLAGARALGAAPGEARVRRALARVGDAETDPAAVKLWSEALVCLSHHGRDPAVKQLRKAVLGADSPRRAAALEALGSLRERRAEREILRAMASDDAAVFAEAACAAVLIEAQGAVATLVARLATGPHVRAASRALALAVPWPSASSSPPCPRRAARGRSRRPRSRARASSPAPPAPPACSRASARRRSRACSLASATSATAAATPSPARSRPCPRRPAERSTPRRSRAPWSSPSRTPRRSSPRTRARAAASSSRSSRTGSPRRASACSTSPRSSALARSSRGPAPRSPSVASPAARRRRRRTCAATPSSCSRTCCRSRSPREPSSCSSASSRSGRRSTAPGRGARRARGAGRAQGQARVRRLAGEVPGPRRW
jgi:hypothetical protein